MNTIENSFKVGNDRVCRLCVEQSTNRDPVVRNLAQNHFLEKPGNGTRVDVASAGRMKLFRTSDDDLFQNPLVGIR